MRRLASLLTVLALCAPAVASGEVLQASDVDESNSQQAATLIELAQAYWGYSACVGQYQVIVGPITDQPKNPDGTGGEPIGEAAIPGCFMRIVPRTWHGEGPDGELELCAAFIHEYGHSLGHQHTADPASVMDPFTALTTGLPPECPVFAENRRRERQEAQEAARATFARTEALAHRARHHRRPARKSRKAGER